MQILRGKNYAIVLSTNISALSRGHAKKKAYQGIRQHRICRRISVIVHCSANDKLPLNSLVSLVCGHESYTVCFPPAGRIPGKKRPLPAGKERERVSGKLFPRFVNSPAVYIFTHRHTCSSFSIVFMMSCKVNFYVVLSALHYSVCKI